MPTETITRSSNIPEKAEWERLVANAANIAGPLAASVREPTWKPANDSIESGTKALTRVQGSTKPVLDLPPSMDQDTFEKGKVDLSKFIAPKDPINFAIDIDDLVHDLLTSLARDSSSYAQTKRQFLEQERAWSDQKEAEKITQLQNQIDSAKTVNAWGKVEQSLASIGLIASGIICLSAAPTGVGAVLGTSAIAFGSMLLIDQILDNAAKKVVASWIAKDSQEEQSAWVNRIELFCGLSSFALSVGTSPSSAVQLAMNISKSVVGGVKDVAEWRLSAHKALNIELDAETRVAQKSVDTIITGIQEICDTIRQFHENLHHIEEKRQQVAHSMLRFAET